MKQLRSDRTIAFAQVLFALQKAGLTERQYAVLEMIGYTSESVDGILEAAKENHEALKVLIEDGYKLLPEGQTIQAEQLQNGELVKVIGFVAASTLDQGGISDDNQELFVRTVVDEEYSLGENQAVKYTSLFSFLPYVIEGDLVKSKEENNDGN